MPQSFTRAILAYAPRAVLIAAVLSFTGVANAETHIIEMLNYDREDPTKVMVFKPEVIRIAPGDTVRWVSTDDFHNAASIDGMIPDGAQSWESPLSEDFEMTFDVEGTYGFACTPHSAIGMVGLVLVGDHTTNIDAAKAVAHPFPAVAQKFESFFETIE